MTEYPWIPSVVPSLPERPNREYGRNADIPEAPKQGVTYLWIVPKPKNYMKVEKVSILVNSVSYYFPPTNNGGG